MYEQRKTYTKKNIRKNENKKKWKQTLSDAECDFRTCLLLKITYLRKKIKKYRNKIHFSLVNSKTSIDKLLESNKSFYTANMLTLLYPLIRAQQFARTVTSVHVTYTQRGFHVQEITRTRINHNIFK